MQAFSAVHLQHLRSAFAVLAEGIRKDRCIEQVVVQPSQSQAEVSAKQLASLIHTQEAHTQSLQAIAAQLIELTELAKQLKPDTNFFSVGFSKKQTTENVITPKVAIALESTRWFDAELATTEIKTGQSCQAYFSHLPWSSEMFATVAAKMRESKPSAEIPQIMQLATESALKTAAEAATLSESSPEQELFLGAAFQDSAVPAADNLFAAFEPEAQHDSQEQSCGDYFQTLPWATKTEIQLSADYANAEQDSAIDIVFADESAPAAEYLFAVFESETQHHSQGQSCGDYFQTLPWATKTEIQLSADYANAEQDSVIDIAFADELAPASEDLFTVLESEIQLESPAQTCGAYFQAVPWQTATEIPLFSADILLGDEIVQTEEDFFQNFIEEMEVTPETQECRHYFQSLPWIAKKAVINDGAADKANSAQTPLQKRKALLEAIFANKATNTDQDFVKMLEQETEPLGQAAAESQQYFQTLPWG